MIRTFKRLFAELPIACHLEHSGEHCLLTRCAVCPTLLFDIQKTQKQSHKKGQSNLVQSIPTSSAPFSRPFLSRYALSKNIQNTQETSRSRKVI